MLNTVKELILNAQEMPLETGSKRELSIVPLKGKATVCIGVRRCGKSTYGFQLMKKLLAQGVARENILYLNFFDNRLHNISRTGLEVVTEAYFSLYPQKKNSEKIYCFFDEIQVISGWEPFIERLLRTEKCEIFITGSSAHLLSKDIATQMRGRALSWELFPFSFTEFLENQKIPYKENLSTKQRLLLQQAFDNYWETGGFPEVVGLDKSLRVKIHQEYFYAILFRDLVERHNISHSKALSDLAQRLIENSASLYSINALTGYLKSLGHKLPKASVADYIAWFEDAYFLFTVRIFDASLARKNTNPKKIYCIDHAFISSISSGILKNSGHLLENMVFLALRRTTENIHYYKTKSGKEVDFITTSIDRTFSLLQVSESLDDEKTKKREVSALVDAMSELHITTSLIVTRNQEEVITTDAGIITVLPVWKFLLMKGGAL